MEFRAIAIDLDPGLRNYAMVIGLTIWSAVIARTLVRVTLSRRSVFYRGTGAAVILAGGWFGSQIVFALCRLTQSLVLGLANPGTTFGFIGDPPPSYLAPTAGAVLAVAVIAFRRLRRRTGPSA